MIADESNGPSVTPANASFFARSHLVDGIEFVAPAAGVDAAPVDIRTSNQGRFSGLPSLRIETEFEVSRTRGPVGTARLRKHLPKADGVRIREVLGDRNDNRYGIPAHRQETAPSLPGATRLPRW
jgi:hypothetical protein